MAGPVASLVSSAVSPSGVSNAPDSAERAELTQTAARTSSAGQAKLKRACQDFESLFLSYLLKSMRETAVQMGPGDEEAGSGLMTEWTDEILAGAVARGGGLGLARMLEAGLGAEAAGPEIGSSLGTFRPDVYGRTGKSVPDGADTYGRMVNRAARENGLHPAIGRMVNRAARENGLHPALLESVIEQESGGRPDAVSPKGAKGLMQLMDETAKDMGVGNVFDPEENIRGGARYLRQLLDRWKGNLEKALAAYNAGPAAVEKYGGVPPFAETQTYVRRVLNKLASAGVVTGLGVDGPP